MSYVKVSRSFPGPGKRPVRSRRATKTKPKQEWVSTVHDLTVHRATPEELSRRREIHQSKNRAAAQLELKERAVRRSFRRSHLCSHTALDCARQCITREYQLQDALAQSDQAIALVKDLFGDAPRRHIGFPHVTVAPSAEPRYPEVPLLQRAEPLTQLSVDSQVSNELDRDSEEEGSEDEPSAHSTWKRDVRRSNALLLQDAHFHEERENGRLTPDPQAPRSCSSNHSDVSEDQQAALNATLQVRRVRARTARCESDSPSLLISQVLNPSRVAPKKPDKKTKPCGISRTEDVSRLNTSALSSLSGNQSSLEVLQGMLGEVEEQLDSLAPRDAPKAVGTQQGAPSLTGFSMSLVSSLGRLARQLRQSHEEVQKEVEHRKSLEEEVQEQRRLLDALTVESLSLREENTALQKHLKELEQRLDTLLLAAGGLGQPGKMGTKEGSGPPNNDSVMSHIDAAVALERVQEEALLPPAVLLSPPRQMDSQPLSAQAQGRSLQYQDVTTRSSAVVPEMEERNEPRHSRSIPSFASLPHLSSSWDPSTVLTHRLTSVSDPCQQHYWIGAQPEHLCSASLGGAPQEPGTETRTACRVATSTAWQTTLMEERLLELNRQSAAARSKILALIEQQRQEAGGSASPSISPVPPGASRTPQVAIFLSERDHPVDNNYGRRCV